MTLATCPRCDGTGEVPLPDESGRAWTVCPTCHGRCQLNRPDPPKREAHR